jgi:hypothetical protein
VLQGIMVAVDDQFITWQPNKQTGLVIEKIQMD